MIWLHHYRLVEGKREDFKHALIIEEAHHVLLRRKQEAMGEETITDIILREIRELGESVILIDQHPSLISKRHIDPEGQVNERPNVAETVILS